MSRKVLQGFARDEASDHLASIQRLLSRDDIFVCPTEKKKEHLEDCRNVKPREKWCKTCIALQAADDLEEALDSLAGPYK